MPDTSALAPLQLIQLRPDHFQTEEGINELSQYLSILTQRVNAVGPSTGSPAEFPNGINLHGSHIANLGGLGPEHAGVSLYLAEQRYSAKAISPQLEAGQPNAPKSLRRVNDGAQQEKYSTFLNSAMNTAPTSNTSTLAASGFTVTISAGYHEYVDGSLVSYGMRSDTLAASSPIAIVSITRSSGIVTVVTATPDGLAPADSATIAGVTDSSFDGTFTVSTIVNPTTFKYSQSGPDATSSGGTLASGRVYYYYLQRGKRVLSLSQPFATDTQSNRISVNQDGTVLIAVVVVNGSGIDLTQSAAGATAPSLTNNNHLLFRL